MNKEWTKKNLANMITCLRIAGTVVMIAMPTLGRGFFIAYTFAGVTDALDGFVARKTGTTSKFGAKLDSAADLFFYISMMIKILPYLFQYLPKFVMIAIFAIFAARVLFYAIFGILTHKFVSNHTILNKITGLLIFLVPYFVRLPFFTFYASFICVVAIVSLVIETIITKDMI